MLGHEFETYLSAQLCLEKLKWQLECFDKSVIIFYRIQICVHRLFTGGLVWEGFRRSLYCLRTINGPGHQFVFENYRKVVFSLVWLAFILFHICLVHFLKTFSPLHIHKIPSKRARSNEIELRTVFKLIHKSHSLIGWQSRRPWGDNWLVHDVSEKVSIWKQLKLKWIQRLYMRRSISHSIKMTKPIVSNSNLSNFPNFFLSTLIYLMHKITWKWNHSSYEKLKQPFFVYVKL